MWPRSWWPTDTQMDFMKSAPSTPTAAGAAKTQSIFNISVDPIDFGKYSVPLQRQNVDKRFSRNYNDGISATSINFSAAKSAVKADCNGPRKPLPTANHPAFLSKMKGSQSFSAAVLTSLTTTSDWIKTEVRRRGSLSRDHRKELNDALNFTTDSRGNKEDVDKEDSNDIDDEENEDYDNDDDDKEIDNYENENENDDDGKLSWEEIYSPTPYPTDVSCINPNTFPNILKIESSTLSPVKLTELATLISYSPSVSLCSSPLPAHFPTPIPDSSNISNVNDPGGDGIITPSPDHSLTRQILDSKSSQFPSRHPSRSNYSNSVNVITDPQSTSISILESHNLSSSEFDSLIMQDDCFHPTSPKPNEVELQTIMACEAMNELIYEEQYEKEQQDERVSNTGEEDVKIGKKWIEKFGEVSERLQFQFAESPPFFNKFPSLSRSRSDSEATMSLSGITVALTDFLTPISETYRNHSFSFSGTMYEYSYVLLSFLYLIIC